MQQETFYILDQNPVIIEWAGEYINLSVSHNGNLLHKFGQAAEFRDGFDVALDATNTIRLAIIGGRLAVWHEGKNLMEVRDETVVNEDFNNAISTLKWYGGFQTIIGTLILILAQAEEYRILGLGAIISGVILLGLSFWAFQKQSKIPLWIGFALCLINILATVAGGKMGGIIVSAFIAFRLYKGATSSVKSLETNKYKDTNILDSDL